MGSGVPPPLHGLGLVHTRCSPGVRACPSSGGLRCVHLGARGRYLLTSQPPLVTSQPPSFGGRLGLLFAPKPSGGFLNVFSCSGPSCGGSHSVSFVERTPVSIPLCVPLGTTFAYQYSIECFSFMSYVCVHQCCKRHISGPCGAPTVCVPYRHR